MPTASSVTVALDAVHTAGVVDEKLTTRPDDALAATVNCALLNASLENVAKLMV
jgi:hypothetical protein